MSTAGPLQLEPPRRVIVRLNRRVIYLVGAALVVAFVTGLLAVRAQGTRQTDAGAERRLALAPRSRPWFVDVPDQDPAPRAALDPPSPAATAASAKVRTTDEHTTDVEERQRRQRGLRAAMSAPIGVPAFERSSRDQGAPRPAGRASAVATRQEPSSSALPADYLQASQRTPVSPYEIKAGTIVPAVMLTGINSDLPGQIVGQVRENVYDSDTGEHLLIPQGTRLVGLYDHHVVYGQQRVLITWKRLVFPNGSSLGLGDGMPGSDAIGAAGAGDQVNNHYLKIFGNALLLSVISAGVQLSQGPDFGHDFRGPSAGNVLAAAAGQQFASVSSEMIRRGMNVAPTLEIRPGYALNVMVTHDVIFPGPYQEGHRE